MIRVFSFLLCFCLALAACTKEKSLRIGVTPGPHAIIAGLVKEKAAQEGMAVEIIEFNDYILPNKALADGEIDVNIFQHVPYLENQLQTRKYKLKAIAKTVLMPLRGYSKKINSLEELPNGAKIAIPNDPTNGSRSLKLLEKAGLLKLKIVDQPTVLDIADNPKDLKILEVEAPQIPRVLDDVYIGVINTEWVLLAGLDPDKAIFSEEGDNPYTNVMVVREGDENRQDIQRFVSLYQTAEIKEATLKAFKKAIIPMW